MFNNNVKTFRVYKWLITDENVIILYYICAINFLWTRTYIRSLTKKTIKHLSFRVFYEWKFSISIFYGPPWVCTNRFSFPLLNNPSGILSTNTEIELGISRLKIRKVALLTVYTIFCNLVSRISILLFDNRNGVLSRTSYYHSFYCFHWNYVMFVFF